MKNGGQSSLAGWRLGAAVFGFVLVAQLLLVALAGTDIPFQDQWDVEGRWLFPAWCDGTLRAPDLLRAHNEHRIIWTNGLNLALFAANGQWDPLVEMAAGAVVRAAVAAGLFWLLARDERIRRHWLIAAGVAVAFLPHLAWQNTLWGFQSQVYFALGFSLAALALLGTPAWSMGRLVAGLLAACAAQLAMGPGLLVPVALLLITGLRTIEHRQMDSARWREIAVALLLLVLAWRLHADVPGHAGLRAGSMEQFLVALMRALAWPHVWLPAAALVLNLPLLMAMIGRVAGWRRAKVGEDFVMAAGFWAMTIAGAVAWTRGGSPEFSASVPSRYADFLVLLPLANCWCAVTLVEEASSSRLATMRTIAVVWGAFLFMGWLGLSTEVMHRLILPRMRDRDAPVRLTVTFQRTGDSAVFQSQPPLLVPHPEPGVVREVLHDPRLDGKLPPSLQPARPLGSLSRATRFLMGR